MLDFYRTQAGRKLIDHTLPQLVKQLARIADALEAQQEGTWNCPACGKRRSDGETCCPEVGEG